MQQIVFASHNKHKIEEAQKILGKNFRIITLHDLNCRNEIPETAKTLEGNAILKAQYVYKNYRLNCFADDSGLEINALDNKPGVMSARYAGDGKNDNENIQKVLAQLSGKSDRAARFRTVIAVIINGEEHLFEGTVNGQITEKPAGEAGFGYDPIFIPDQHHITFAQMSANQKNTISHRYLALQQLKLFLDEINP
jgi:XTP/dITP diphosphohydrolase